MDTDSLYLALAKKDMYDCIHSDKQFFHERVVAFPRSTMKDSRRLRCYVNVARLINAMTTSQTR